MQARRQRRAISAQGSARLYCGLSLRDGLRTNARALSSTPFSAILILEFAAEALDAGGAE